LLINQASLRLDFRQHRAWLGQVELELSAREMFLLERLARQPNEIVSLAELVQATHDLSTNAQEASQLVRPLIRTLRRKLEAHLGREPWLKNVRGRGYLLVAERAGVDLDPQSS
jgi:DNA-binding response OmpR family regulator